MSNSSNTIKQVGRNVVVVGTQWGDEGKGKLVDWLTESAGGVVRFQGGHNAGHTLVINGVKTAKPWSACCRATRAKSMSLIATASW